MLDVAPYLGGDTGALQRLGRELRHAFEQVGFYYLRGHGVPQALIDATFEQAERFHAMPLDRKLALRINEHNIGYMPMGGSIARSSTVHRNRKPSVNEAFFLRRERTPDDPDVIANKRFRGLNRWPDGSAGISRHGAGLHDGDGGVGPQAGADLCGRAGPAGGLFRCDVRAPEHDPAADALPAAAQLRRRRIQHRTAHRLRLHDIARAIQGAGAVDPAAGRHVVRCAVDRGRIRRQWRRHPAALDERPVPLHAASRDQQLRAASVCHPVLLRSASGHADRVCAQSCCSAGDPPKYEPVTYDQYALWYATQNYVHLAQATEEAPKPVG